MDPHSLIVGSHLAIPRTCCNCDIPIRDNGQVSLLCDVCATLIAVLSTRPYFVRLHREWLDENEALLAKKRKLLTGEGYSDVNPS